MDQQEKMPVILIGASTRAMAYSCLRAGVQPFCIDLFADKDLMAVASVSNISLAEYPMGLVQAVEQFPLHWSVIYTGGIENHPQVYRAIEQQRPVWGYTHPNPLHGNSIRNPKFLDALAAEHRLHRPKHSWNDSPNRGVWLIKPLASAGGRGIQYWSPNEPVSPSHYLDEFLEGVPFSAIFLNNKQGTRYLGCSRQLIGTPWLHAPSPFSYCGNIGPIQLDSSSDDYILHLGSILTKHDPFLAGLFGVDLIMNDNQIYLIEVNPRYTASVELLELASGQSYIAKHVQTYHESFGSKQSSTSVQLIGKAVYYAPSDCVFPHEAPYFNQQIDDLWRIPQCADIPTAGTQFAKGQPVLTLYAQGADKLEIVHRLREKAVVLDELLFHRFST